MKDVRETNDPMLASWVDVPSGSDFPIQNLPFGIFQTDELAPRAGVAIGEFVIDLVFLQERGYFSDLGLPVNIFAGPVLN
ncbi:MAG: fumarylacetoacetase, partial [Bacteroidota bacterium]|nr:fumarylacetoacetase [Bacteroidota bacterium]